MAWMRSSVGGLMRFRETTPFHRLMAYFGIGDLHPGGVEITERLLGWLDGHDVQDILEIGPGMGLSTRRLAARGWNVVAVERDPVLRSRLQGAKVFVNLEDAFAHGPFDAVFAESVLYGLPLQEVLPRLWELLRPGGVLVFCDMLWSRDAVAKDCAHYHDQSLELFGIAMIPREPLTWALMSDYLRQAGFGITKELRFNQEPRRSMRSIHWGRVMAALAWRPHLAIDWLLLRGRMKLVSPPSHWLENWAGMAVKLPEREAA